MNFAQQQFVDALARCAADSEALESSLYELVETLEGSNPLPVLPAVIAFIEAHPDAEIGNPGPLVHLAEGTACEEYVEFLLESLQRKPVSHTVWMAHRLLNAPVLSVGRRRALLEALDGVALHPAAEMSTKERAARFVERQRSLENRVV